LGRAEVTVQRLTWPQPSDEDIFSFSVCSVWLTCWSTGKKRLPTCWRLLVKNWRSNFAASNTLQMIEVWEPSWRVAGATNRLLFFFIEKWCPYLHAGRHAGRGFVIFCVRCHGDCGIYTQPRASIYIDGGAPPTSPATLEV